MILPVQWKLNLPQLQSIIHINFFHKMDNEIIDKKMVTGEFRKLVKEFLKSKTVKNRHRAYFNYGIINYIYGEKKFLPCEAGIELFYMDSPGEIRPCDDMKETMENIREKTAGKTLEPYQRNS